MGNGWSFGIFFLVYFCHYFHLENCWSRGLKSMISFAFPFVVGMVEVLSVCAVDPALFFLFLFGLKVLGFSLFYWFCFDFVCGLLWGWFFIGLL